MPTLPDVSLSTLACQTYQYLRRTPNFGTVDTVGLRKDGESKVRPPTQHSFVDHIRHIPYEIALRTRIPVVLEILKLRGGSPFFDLSCGSSIRVVDNSVSLNSVAQGSAAIIREDASLVVWSSHLDAFDQEYRDITHELELLARRLEREKSVPTMDDLFCFEVPGEYPDQCSPDWDSLVSLPELTHHYHVHNDLPTTTGGDASTAYYPWPLEYTTITPLHRNSPARELSPLSSSPSSWTTPYLSSDTLTSYGSPETANLADISPPPHIIPVDGAPQPHLPGYQHAGFDFDAAQAYQSSPSLSSRLHPSAAASARASPSLSPAPTTQNDMESRYLTLMADVGPTNATGSSYRSRLRSSSIMLATSDVLPSISRSSRERQARVSVSNRATPYPTNKRKPAPVVKSAATRAPRRATKASLQHPVPSRKRVREDEDDAELTDDSDDEYRDRSVPKKAKRVTAKVKNVKQGKGFGSRTKRRRTKSYDLTPKYGKKFACIHQPKGCKSKCTRIGDTSRHMVFSCEFRENKEFKSSESLCLECGVHQARADALKRHIRDRHDIKAGKFPPGYIAARIAAGKTEDYMIKYESIHKDATAELQRVTELLNRKYRRSGMPPSDEEPVSLSWPAVAAGLAVVDRGVEGDGGDTDDSSDEDDD